MFINVLCRYDQHQDRLQNRIQDINGVSSILRQTNNRFRRDERQMDEDEELWFNDDECEEESAEAVTSGSGEPDKNEVTTTPDKPDKVEISGTTETENGGQVRTIDKVMEEDKKKELLKDIPATGETSPVLNGAKKSMGLVDYNDSDSDGEGDNFKNTFCYLKYSL